MLAYFLPALIPFFSASDVTVGNASAVTLAQISVAGGRWNIPFGGFNFRPHGDNTQDITLEVWWEFNDVQKTAKIPLNVVLGEGKRPFFLTISARDIFDMAFWQAKFSSAGYIKLKAQTQAEEAIVSDKYTNILQVGPT